MLIVDSFRNTRVKQHPFTWAGYCDQTAETKAACPSDTHDHKLFFSVLKPDLIMVERIVDGLIRFKVRGQWYSTLQAARRVV